MEFSLLLKRALKSIFHNKLFVVLMMLLLFISSVTYTTFESASNSFETSYNGLVKDGKLHDVVVKENFKADVKLVNPSNQNQLEVSQPNLLQVMDTTTNGVKTITFSNGSTIDVDYQGDIDQTYSEVADEAAQQRLSLKEGLADQFVLGLNELYAGELKAEERKSLTVTAGPNAYKIVEYDPNAEVNILKTYDGSSEIKEALTPSEMEQGILDVFNTSTKRNDTYQEMVNRGYIINTTKQFRYSYSLGPFAGSYTDDSAFQSIISPSYASDQGKEPISKNEIESIVAGDRYGTPGDIVSLVENKDFQSDYYDNLMFVDQTPYFIIGVGTTPDFAYPIIDDQHPTVDVSSQSLVFVNPMGYRRIWDGYRTNPTENYISIRFDGVSSSREDAIMNEIEEISQDPSSAPALAGASTQLVNRFSKNYYAGNINMVTRYDDEEDQMTLTQERVSFLDDLQSTIKTLSVLTTTMLAVFVALIVVMVFRVVIGSQRKSLATLMALGTSKNRVALSTATISLIIGAIPAVLGYLMGWAMQIPFVNAFQDFWTIPVFDDSFSFVSLIIVVLLPTFALFFLIWVVTLAVLSRPITMMLSTDVSNNSSTVAKLTKPFAAFGIKVKYAIALTFRNSGKLLMVAAATSISAIALMVGMSTLGRADDAYKATMRANAFEYKVDLYSPTKEGGEYNKVTKVAGSYLVGDHNGPTASYRDTYLEGTTGSLADKRDAALLSEVNQQIPHWHNVSPGDSYYINAADLTGDNDADMYRVASNYLNNAIQFKPMLNENVIAFSPWAVAEQLMPDNQKNTAIDNENEMVNDMFPTFFTNKLGPNYAATDQDSQEIVDQLLSQTVYDAEGDQWNPYVLTYGTVLTDYGDETYTYIDSDIHFSDTEKNYHVTGVDADTSMLKIGSKINRLTNYNGNNVPILINEYWSENYDLDTGDTLSATVNNFMDRTFSSGHADIKYEIVGVIDTYNDSDPITLRTEANNLLGMTPDAFNGLYTKNEDSAFMSSVPLYSPVGMYFGTDTINGGWNSVVDNRLATIDPVAEPQYEDLVKNVHNSTEFINHYTSSPIVGAMDHVVWDDMERQAFESVSDLSSTLINVIEGVTIALSVIFTVIVTTLITRTNRKRIATLWTLGYRKKEVMRIFSSSFIPSALIALAIAIPLSFGILAILRQFIMQFGHILIPFSLTFWAPLAVAGIIALIFIGTVVYSIGTLKQSTALQAFKED